LNQAVPRKLRARFAENVATTQYFERVAKTVRKKTRNRYAADIERGQAVLKGAMKGGAARRRSYDENSPDIEELAVAYWTKKPQESARGIGRFLSAKGFGPFETLRKKIAALKPTKKTG